MIDFSSKRYKAISYATQSPAVFLEKKMASPPPANPPPPPEVVPEPRRVDLMDLESGLSKHDFDFNPQEICETYSKDDPGWDSCSSCKSPTRCSRAAAAEEDDGDIVFKEQKRVTFSDKPDEVYETDSDEFNGSEHARETLV